ncbi:hypothetical protein [Acetobacter senegalensis]|uniref:hypothetical protein n=1 Tax=Acetobacter senegalensis TaxID=446692 RepID=UPI001EDBBD15|nr:hypothetical protein [Acetobacter senegalensis]MCG4255618.1 hypothetical protein [Acetobacter senegalensis]MCG4265525.1 hypothetical protein [Acetobacter senegalensis]
MKLASIGAYLRQPTTLIALGIALGTGVADWFGALPEGVSVGLLVAVLPLLAVSDTSGILTKVSTDRDGLAAIVHALTTHKDIGPAAIKVASDAVPGGALLAAAASALVQQQAATSTPASKSSGIGSGAAGLLLLIGLSGSLVACSGDQRQQAVYSLSLSYSAAAQMAVDYEHNVAADPAVVAKLKPAFQKAHDLIAPLDDAAANGDPLPQAEVEAAQAALDAARKMLPATTN